MLPVLSALQGATAEHDHAIAELRRRRHITIIGTERGPGDAAKRARHIKSQNCRLKKQAEAGERAAKASRLGLEDTDDAEAPMQGVQEESGDGAAAMEGVLKHVVLLSLCCVTLALCTLPSKWSIQRCSMKLICVGAAGVVVHRSWRDGC